MKTELYSISKIFTERLLRIPDYQRGYAWKEKQLKEFWADIRQVEDGHNHYVGVLTLEDVASYQYKKWVDDTWIIESKRYEPHYIVDGQQRLTTTIILIQCILENIGDCNLNYTSPDEIKKKYIYESKDGGISRSYLFGYEEDNPSYEFLKQKIFCEPSDLSMKIEETIYTNNLMKAKDFFTEKLKELEFSEIEKIYTVVTQSLLFNIYSMSEEIDVHVSFETMNNRGKPLSHLELLKNRLIYLTTKVDTESYERSKLRQAINECWKTIYHQLGRNKDNPLDDDEFLFNHFVLFYGAKINNGDVMNYRYFRRGYSSYYQEYLLENKFTTKSLNSEDDKERLEVPELYNYVSSLKSSVEKWYEIYNPEDSSLDVEIIDSLTKINRLPTENCLPLVMVALQKVTNKSLLVKFLNSLERLLFCMVFISRSYMARFNESHFIEWACELSDEKVNIEKITSRMVSLIDKINESGIVLKDVSSSLKDGGFYRWRGIQYFMYEYEELLLNNSKTFSRKLDWEVLKRDERDHKTVEHIYPQNPRKECWKQAYSKYSSKERSILRHTIGNLVPLSSPKNSSFQNKPFLEKVSNESNTIGFKYGSFSEIELTNNKEWTAFEILKRSLKLLWFIEKRWGITLGDTKDKIDFLNLGFVVSKESLAISRKTVIKK